MPIQTIPNNGPPISRTAAKAKLAQRNGSSLKMPGLAPLEAFQPSLASPRRSVRANLSQSRSIRQRVRSHLVTSKKRMVRAVGIEPTLLAEPDFESGASTNSTTPACQPGVHDGRRSTKRRPIGQRPPDFQIVIGDNHLLRDVFFQDGSAGSSASRHASPPGSVKSMKRPSLTTSSVEIRGLGERCVSQTRGRAEHGRVLGR
jgi:hypothetical protein